MNRIDNQNRIYLGIPEIATQDRASRNVKATQRMSNQFGVVRKNPTQERNDSLLGNPHGHRCGDEQERRV